MIWELPVKKVHARVGDVPDREAAAVITHIKSPTLTKARTLLNFWTDRQNDGGVVVGRDVPSRALGPVLHSLILFEPIDGGQDWRIRLAGTALLRRFGRDVSGELISDLYPSDHFNVMRSRVRTVVDSGKPHIDDVVIQNSERTLQHFECVHVPVFAPDRVAQWDMAGYFYFH